jgi:hypothetical protein
MPQKPASEERKARMRATSAERYRRTRAKIGMIVGTRRAPNRLAKRPNPQRRKVRDFVTQSKIKIGECCDCGFPCDGDTHPLFDFDHLPTHQKLFTVSRAAQYVGSRPWSQTVQIIQAEIAKCELVCSNCHRIRTFYLRSYLNEARAKPPKTPILRLFEI